MAGYELPAGHQLGGLASPGPDYLSRLPGHPAVSTGLQLPPGSLGGMVSLSGSSSGLHLGMVPS